MAFNECPNCKRLYWNGERHQCPPAWMVYLHAEGYGKGDVQRFYAEDPKEAAVEFAARYDSGDYTLMNGGEIDVVVFRTDEPEKRYVYTVTGEVEPHYYVSGEKHPDWAEIDTGLEEL